MNTTQPDRQYYYRPMQVNEGETLKCAGFGAEDPKHRAFYLPWFDSDEGLAALSGRYLLKGVVVLQGFHGDRIAREYANEHKLSHFNS